MSLPRQVEIVEPLTPVQLVIKGQTLIGQLIRMEAYHYEGSNVIYTWNFGDGQSRSSTSSVVRHIYQRSGACTLDIFYLDVIILMKSGRLREFGSAFRLSVCQDDDLRCARVA